MSAYEMGYAAGTAVFAGVGIFLIVNAAKRLQSSNRKLPPALASVTPPPSSTLPATAGAPGNEFFFAGPVTSASPPPPPPGTHPGGTDTRWHADYSTQGLVPAQPLKASSNVAAIVMLIIGVGLATSALVHGYQQFFAPGRTIEMPDNILGMERIDPDSDMGRQFDASWQQVSTLPGGEKLDAAAYISGSRVLVVAAGESAPSNSAEVDDFFAGIGTGITQVGPELTLSEVDPGLLGGEMQCTSTNSQGIGACAWVDHDTVGVVVVAAAGLDVADTARQAREAVEQ